VSQPKAKFFNEINGRPSKLVTTLRPRRKALSSHGEGREMRNRANFIEIEVFGPHYWESRISSGGVAIQVSRLRQRVLVK
jgi:hypothetical protein